MSSGDLLGKKMDLGKLSGRSCETRTDFGSVTKKRKQQFLQVEFTFML